MAWSPDDLRSADVTTKLAFQLTNDRSIDTRYRRTILRNASTINGELGMRMEAETIAPSLSTLSLLVFDTSRTKASPKFSVNYGAFN